MRLRSTVLPVVFLLGCGSKSNPPKDGGPEASATETGTGDAPSKEIAGDVVTSDAGANADSGDTVANEVGDVASMSPDAAADASSTAVVVVVAETAPGATVAPTSWGSVLRFDLVSDGATMVPGIGIAKSAVADPVGLGFRVASSELFVGNRHGNNSGDAVAGSVSRFLYDRAHGTFTPNGTITGNGLSSAVQVAFSPVSGEMFVANYGQAPGPTGGGISRFTFDAAGVTAAHGTLGDGPGRGVAIAPDGKRLYYTVATTVIRQFDLKTSAELTPFTVTSPGTFRLHLMAVNNGELYVAGVDDNLVFRFTIGADDGLTIKDTITADAPVAVGFSPDGHEMFTAGHLTSDLIDRFSYDATSDKWSPTMKLATTSSLGGVVAF